MSLLIGTGVHPIAFAAMWHRQEGFNDLSNGWRVKKKGEKNARAVSEAEYARTSVHHGMSLGTLRDLTQAWSWRPILILHFDFS